MRFTVPCKAAELFEVDEPPGRGKPPAAPPAPRERGTSEGAKIGRNEPCPCGSGKKYKRCCLQRDEERERGKQTYAGAGGERAEVHNLDKRLTLRMYRYAEERFGRNWIDHASEVFLDKEVSNELLDSWAMHHHLLDGKPLSSREVDQAILEMKTKHYADWADHPLPALGGRTPREAAGTKEGRREVDLLLKDLENQEARRPAGQRYDVGLIRRDLGLGE